MTFTSEELNAMSLFKLKETAKKVGVCGYSKYTASTKHELVSIIMKATCTEDPIEEPKAIVENDTSADDLCVGMSSLTVAVEEKRKLTANEIEEIVMSIPMNKSIPQTIALSHITPVRERVRVQLQSVEVYPSIIPELTEEIVKQYNMAKVNAGEVVGIITAQSIGERQTQMTLDTFHSAGAALKTVITGVPRFSELLSATKNPKSVVTHVHTTKKYSTINEIRNTIGSSLPFVKIGDVLCSVHEEGLDRAEWYTGYEMIYGTRHHEYTRHVTLELDVSKLFTNRIELDVVASHIEEYTDLVCVYSPTFLGRIDVYIDTHNIQSDKIAEYITTTVIPNLKEVRINGIEGITDVYYENKCGEWMMETAGSNLTKMFNHEGIDTTKTVSNDMWEIVNVLGIEAGREFLVNEFMDTISSDGTYVNKCHIELLVDTMTFGGGIMSVSRYGQRLSKCGPLARASFEESFSNLIKAGVTGEVENLTSVSSSIIVGKLASCGTGTFDVLVDFEKLASVGEDEGEYDENTVYEM